MSTTTPDQIDALIPGSTIRCTVEREPLAKGPRDTLARLMRMDPANARALRRAYELRQRRMTRYIRGNRLWTSRETPARVVRVRTGETWHLAYTPHIAPELKSVAAYVTIQKA